MFGTPGDIDNFNDDLLDKPSTDPTAKKIGTLVGWCSLTSVPSNEPDVISDSVSQRDHPVAVRSEYDEIDISSEKIRNG